MSYKRKKSVKRASCLIVDNETIILFILGNASKMISKIILK